MLADNFNESYTRDDGSHLPCEGDVNANVFDWDGDYNDRDDFLMMPSFMATPMLT